MLSMGLSIKMSVISVVSLVNSLVVYVFFTFYSQILFLFMFLSKSNRIVWKMSFEWACIQSNSMWAKTFDLITRYDSIQIRPDGPAKKVSGNVWLHQTLRLECQFMKHEFFNPDVEVRLCLSDLIIKIHWFVHFFANRELQFLKAVHTVRWSQKKAKSDSVFKYNPYRIKNLLLVKLSCATFHTASWKRSLYLLEALIL
jgi:hypothetical protein